MLENQLKTVILLSLLTALLLYAGSLFGPTGFYIAIAIVGIMNFGSYWFSDKIVLMMYRAREVTASSHPRLYNMSSEVAQLANLPMPKVYIIPSANPNAFATGRSPKHSAVAATEGILKLLNDDELKGVIAHEFAHIKNRDILISTVAGMIAGVIGYLASMAQWAAIFGGFGGRDRDDNNIVGLLAMAIVTPIIASIIRLAISRSREYLADETGAKIINNPYGLASALEKIHNHIPHNPMRFGNNATAHLFIANPFSGKSFLALFSTHPPAQERIKRLKDMNI